MSSEKPSASGAEVIGILVGAFLGILALSATLGLCWRVFKWAGGMSE